MSAKSWRKRVNRQAENSTSGRYRRFLNLESLEDRTLPTGSALVPSYVLFNPPGGGPADSASPYTTAFTPAGIKQAYGINLVNGDGSGETIAIVDAYDDPDLACRSSTLPLASDTAFLASDLHQFDVQYGLPEPAGFFTKVNQSGGTTYPSTDPAGPGNKNWEGEEALDVEWVHALAPGAKIILVEANDSSDANLFGAVAWAGGQSGAQVVSMSFGESEFSAETTYDSKYFVQPAGYGVTYLAASGDSGVPALYPATSPQVVAVGGTTLTVDAGGNYSSEVGWSATKNSPYSSGGGFSAYEAQPAYQGSLTQYSPYRTTPDVSFDADKVSGVSVYDSYNGASTGGPWWQLGGTSVACPCWAALIGIADGLRAAAGLGSLDGPTQTLPMLYQLYNSPTSYTQDFHDITTGNNGYPAGPGYDLVTGIGTPIANKLVPDLVGQLSVSSSTPAEGTSVAAPPTVFSVTFWDPIDPSSLNPNALSINGIAGTGVTLDSTDTVATFTFSTSPVIVQGPQTMTLAAGAVAALRNNATTNAGYNATFYYDTLPLAIGSTNPSPGTVNATSASSFPFQVSFNEPIDPSLVSTGNLSLSQGRVAAASVLPGNQTVAFTFTGLSDGPLAVTIAAGTFKDQYDNPASPSFTGSYVLHFPTLPLPTPEASVAPSGSLIYNTTLSSMLFFAGDTDQFTLAADPGQTLAVAVTPTSSTLTTTVQVRDPSGMGLGSATASGPGLSALLQAVPTTTSGTYSIIVGDLGGTTGRFTVQVTLDAALQNEGYQVGVSNNSLGTAQDIDNSFINLGGPASRAAVVSQTAVYTQDFANGAGGFTINNNTIGTGTSAGLWHLSTRLGTPSFYYGNEITGNCQTEANNGGSITSPVIALLAGSDPVLTFNYVLVQYGGDVAVEVSANGFTNAYGSTIGVLGNGGAGGPTYLSNSSTWRTASASLAAFAGQNIQIRWIFDTGTGVPITDYYEGWFVADVVIQPSAPPNDYYAFALSAGESGTLAAKGLTGGSVNLLLENASGTTLASGAAGATNVDQLIANFVAPTTGTYYAVMSGTSPATYSLVVTKDAAWDAETNTTFGTAQDITGTDGVLGTLASAAPEWYRVTLLGAVNALQIQTTTPVGGPSQVLETLDPTIQLYDATDTLIASGSTLAGGRNQSILATGLTPGATYYIEVAPADAGTGEYFLGVTSWPGIVTISLPNWTLNLPGYSQTISATGGSGSKTFATTAGTLPPGLALSSGGILSGTPTTTGSYTFTVSATDSVGSGSNPQVYTVVINPVVSITTATLPSWTMNFVYSQTIMATGGTGSIMFARTAGRLPAGLTLASGGVLSGTPTAAGSYTFTVTANDAVGASASQSYTVVIKPALTLSPGTLPEATENNAYDQTIAVTGGTGTITLLATNINQVPWLIVPNVGLGGILYVTGTPNTTGTETFTVTASDSVGATVSLNYAIVVNPLITMGTASGSLPNWTTGLPYSQTFEASGGTGTLMFFQAQGTLPPGLTLSNAGVLAGSPQKAVDVLSGIPTVPGTYSFTVTAYDTVGAVGGQAYTVTISQAVTMAALPNWTVNQSGFSQTIASGGTGTLTFSFAGTLPSGLTLSSAGVLSGTPTATGSYGFTVTATDTIGASASQQYTVIINPPVTITATTVPNWTANFAGYSQTITTSGGTYPLTFSAAGALPPGLTLSSSGLLAGTPTATGVYNFTVRVTDAVGVSANTSYAVTINPAVTVSPASLPADTASVAYNQVITPSGGTGPLTLAVGNVSGAIPGLTVAINAAGTLNITGTPTAAGTETFTLTASDTVSALASQTYTVVVNPAVSITTASLANWTAGLAGYSQTISASGGTGALTFSAAAASLPPGLTVSSVGVLSGTPTTVGSFTFTLTTTDAVGSSAGQSYTVVIAPAVSITMTSLGNWTAGLPGYSQTISSGGGTGSLTFSETGTLPIGLTLSSGGVLSGTPTVAGSYTFNVTATDTVSASSSQSYTVTINPVLTLFPGVLPAGLLNAAYNRTITANGGTGTVALAVRNITGAIPGLTVPTSATGTLNITGTPTATGTETFTVMATDMVGATTTINYSITITPATVNLNLPSAGFAGSPGSSILAFPININELEDQATPTNHVGLATATLAVSFPTGVFNFPLGSSLASADVSLGSIPLSDTVAPGGAADWILSANSPADGQLNITLSAQSGKNITTNNPATGGSLVVINFPVSSTYNAASPTAQAITVVATNGSFHTAINGNNGAYTLKPLPPYSGSITINSSGSFSQYLVTVESTSTVRAGSGFLVAVQAADALGNPVTSYSGPATLTATISPASAASNFPMTVPISSNGLGFFLASLQQTGTYTISVADSSDTFTGSAPPVTVTPGPAVKLGFATQPVSTPTGDVLPAVTVQIQDLYGNIVTSDDTDTVTVGVASGPGSFTTGSITTATVHNGVATFSNLTLIEPGTYTLSALVPTLYTGPNSSSFTVTPLQVVPGSFAGTPSGFSLQFNAPFLVNSTTPVLYGQGFGATAPVPSVTLTQTKDVSGQAVNVPIAGSLMLNTATNSITFVATDTALQVNNGSPILPDGTYTVIVHGSGATDGFQTLHSGGGFLDGLASGTAGSGAYTATFTVNAAAAHDDVLWVPATADGPGQALNAPGKNQVGGGYPIYLNDSTGAVTSVQVTLNYNPALLTVTGVTGAGFTLLGSSTPGQAVLQYSGPALPAGKQIPIGFITASVPSGTVADPTPYKAKDLLHISNVALNGGAIQVATSDALHLVAYVGDANGDGVYSSDDAVKIIGAALQTDTGFAAYPLVDPVIVADTDGAGFIPADAAVQVNEAAVGYPTNNLPIPPLPSGVVFQAIANNVDPSVSDLQVGAVGTLTANAAASVVIAPIAQSVRVHVSAAHDAAAIVAATSSPIIGLVLPLANALVLNLQGSAGTHLTDALFQSSIPWIFNVGDAPLSSTIVSAFERVLAGPPVQSPSVSNNFDSLYREDMLSDLNWRASGDASGLPVADQAALDQYFGQTDLVLDD